MAYKITSACISCGACIDECPVGAIAEGDGQYVIDEGSCIDCGACCGSCPTGAIEEAYALISYKCTIRIEIKKKLITVSL